MSIQSQGTDGTRAPRPARTRGRRHQPRMGQL